MPSAIAGPKTRPIHSEDRSLRRVRLLSRKYSRIHSGRRTLDWSIPVFREGIVAFPHHLSLLQEFLHHRVLYRLFSRAYRWESVGLRIPNPGTPGVTDRQSDADETDRFLYRCKELPGRFLPSLLQVKVSSLSSLKGIFIRAISFSRQYSSTSSIRLSWRDCRR